MNIILSSFNMTSCKGGAERISAWLANSLAELGHSVTIYAYDEQKRGPSYPLKKAVELRYQPLPLFPEEIEAFRNDLLDLKPDVCVIFTSSHYLMSWIATLDGTGIPLIISERISPSYIENVSWTKAERLTALCGADKIHLLSSEFIDSLDETMRENAVVFGNPVRWVAKHRQTKRLASAEKSKVLLGVGRLHPNKRFDILIEAFHLLRKDFPDWRLEIWGKGDERDKLEKKIAALNLSECALLRGLSDTIESEYPKAEIFCLSSLYEGIPNVLLEAISFGLPCVCFEQCPGVEDVITDGYNGLLAPEATPKSLAKSLALLMSDEELREKMSENALNRADCFREDIILDKWVELIGSVYGVSPTKLQRLKSQKPSYDSHLALQLESGVYYTPKRVNRMIRAKTSLRRKFTDKIRRTINSLIG